MNIFKSFAQGCYYFGLGVSATVSDCKTYLTKQKARQVMRCCVSVSLVAAMLVAGGCSSRSDAVEESSTPEVSSSSVESSSSDKAVAAPAPKVELNVGASRYETVNETELKSMLTKVAEEKKEEVVDNTPAMGDVAAYKANVNSDTVGWITIPDTNINYPVLYHQNTMYYNERGYDKNYSKNGVIWVDGETTFDANGDFASANTVVYGHNWTNCWNPIKIGRESDIMLGQIAAYDDATFAKDHPNIYIKTLSGTHTYQVISVFYMTNFRTEDNIGYFYANPSNMLQLAQAAITRSKHNFGATVAQGDKYITISTCTRLLHPTSDAQRMIVMAKLVK